MNTETLRHATARTIAAGFLAATEGRHDQARAHADGALLGLVNLSAQGVQVRGLVERVARLDERLTDQG
ncbi:hypothetical protein ACOQFV_24450 [Nocardiopsis changdeensis]|uniref:Uncharacterized protein n=1 Tax=Nocardiopsis changdeensis TaxID=2831969 RepID=A0A975KTE9_9ACTN|nr:MULTISPECIES: hypothetical protein [Nocardiopsis]QUX26458.1 hypothetical protein KGD84_32690 [Nocardiopsis changdeensis]QYX40730.1 hypothetical protein K1J57_32540 [Nocardiopsis sp. MT53]